MSVNIDSSAAEPVERWSSTSLSEDAQMSWNEYKTSVLLPLEYHVQI